MKSSIPIQVPALLMLLAALLVWSACSSADTDAGTTDAPSVAFTATVVVPTRYILRQALDVSLSLTSTSVGGTNGWLDKRHTCEGVDSTPNVQWDGVPETAASLVFMIEDPASDAFGTTVDVLWNHWVLYSIPANVTMLDVGQQAGGTVENGANQGTNDFGKVQYNGPCPIPNLKFPAYQGGDARHFLREAAELRSYLFRLYALDTALALPSGANRDTVLEAIDGHIVAAGELAVEFKSRINRNCFTDDVESCLERLGPRW